MTTTFELEHGRSVISAWRLALEERSYEALQLPRDIQALFLPNEGERNLRSLLDDLVYDGALTLDEFAAFVREMCTGANCMQTTQLKDLVVYWRQAPATLAAVAIVAMLRAQVTHRTASVTKADAAATLLALRQTLTPAQLHNILTVTNGNHGTRVIPPSYLRDAATTAYNRQSFATRLANCMAKVNGLDESRKLVALMAALGVPAKDAGELLHTLRAVQVVVPDDFKKMNDFLKAAKPLFHNAAEWNSLIMKPLRNFKTAQRRPFGPNRPFPNTAFDNARTGLRKLLTNGHTLCAPDTHINYICNAHTFAHCDFADRIARNSPIDFWAPTDGKPQVEQKFTGMAELSLHGHFANPPNYIKLDVGQTEVGVELRGPPLATFHAVTHMAPAVVLNRIENNVLVALQHLFDL